MTTDSEKPRSPGLLVADAAYREENTGKLIVAGTFNEIRPRKYPHKHTFAIVFSITAPISMRKPVAIQIQHDESGDVALKGEGELVIENPGTTLDTFVTCPGVTFAKEGVYTIRISVEDTVIGERKLQLRAEEA